MTTLREVHLKIQELSKDDSSIPIIQIVQAFDDDTDVILEHVKSLFILGYMDFVVNKEGFIRLTLNGENTHGELDD